MLNGAYSGLKNLLPSGAAQPAQESVLSAGPAWQGMRNAANYAALFGGGLAGVKLVDVLAESESKS
jgi:hypothetical protein